MENRRTFLGHAARLLPVALGARVTQAFGGAQTAPPQGPTELARHALTGPFEGFEMVLIRLNSAPARGTAGPGHRHPGPVLGYIEEGQMRFGINNQPEQVLPTGATFFEPTGAVHTAAGSASVDAPARALVFMLVPKGSPLTAPA
jgi:quercetin dioxygenase-like cupin family protein